MAAQVKATTHKMLYGHYLQKKNQNITIHCVARSIMERDTPKFLEEAEKRWDNLEKKRGIKVEAAEVGDKKQKLLDSVKAGVDSCLLPVSSVATYIYCTF